MEEALRAMQDEVVCHCLLFATAYRMLLPSILLTKQHSFRAQRLSPDCLSDSQNLTAA